MNNIVKPGGVLQINYGCGHHHGHHCDPDPCLDENPGNCECPEGGIPGPAGPQGPQGPKGDPGQGGMMDLSYEEQFTGAYDRTDPDGPTKIYVKTIDCGELPISGGKYTSTGIENIKNCLWLTGSIISLNQAICHLPHINTNVLGHNHISVYWSVEKNAIGVYTANQPERNKHFSRVTMYYTKKE